jgi:hypothetical protein
MIIITVVLSCEILFLINIKIFFSSLVISTMNHDTSGLINTIKYIIPPSRKARKEKLHTNDKRLNTFIRRDTQIFTDEIINTFSFYLSPQRARRSMKIIFYVKNFVVLGVLRGSTNTNIFVNPVNPVLKQKTLHRCAPSVSRICAPYIADARGTLNRYTLRT